METRTISLMDLIEEANASDLPYDEIIVELVTVP